MFEFTPASGFVENGVLMATNREAPGAHDEELMFSVYDWNNWSEVEGLGS